MNTEYGDTGSPCFRYGGLLAFLFPKADTTFRNAVNATTVVKAALLFTGAQQDPACQSAQSKPPIASHCFPLLPIASHCFLSDAITQQTLKTELI